jgi:hypothetical protein
MKIGDKADADLLEGHANGGQPVFPHDALSRGFYPAYRR